MKKLSVEIHRSKKIFKRIELFWKEANKVFIPTMIIYGFLTYSFFEPAEDFNFYAFLGIVITGSFYLFHLLSLIVIGLIFRFRITRALKAQALSKPESCF